MESHSNTDERLVEKSMDDYLKSIGLYRRKVAKDGSCLFRAVAEQVLHSQSLHTVVRAQCVDYLKKNRSRYEAFIEGDFEEYLGQLQDPQQWVGEVEINALAAIYRRDFLIFQEPGKPPVNITGEKYKDQVQLCFLNRNHYDSVYSLSHIKNSALCQSIVYELLYNGVFNMKTTDLSRSQKLPPSDLLGDDRMGVCVSSDESDVEVDEPLWVDNDKNTSTRHSTRGRGRGRGRGQQLSERVRRSLNPTLFRNIEFDIWHKTKRAQQKLDYNLAAGMQYSVGDQCRVRLDENGRSYNATVKEVPSNNSTLVVVHIEELGRRTVPLWSLHPPSEEGSWSTLVKDKRKNNRHGDAEEHLKGRGRGKSVSSSSVKPQPSVSPLAGHVQKQHSWPPPASAHADGAARTFSQSVSLVEATLFGVTEEERQAKEEEQRSVALVEMQLRDEHSFPALGTEPQGEQGKRRSSEKRSSEKRSSEGRKTKSPVGDIGAVSPSAGHGSQPSTLITPSTAAVTPPPSPDSTPVWLSSIRAPPPTSITETTPVSDVQAVKPSSLSLVAPAEPPSPPSPSLPAPASAATSSSTSVVSFLTPVLPTTSSLPPAPLPFSSSSSSVPHKPSTPPPSVPPSSSAPAFIAPIAPSPVAASGFLPLSSFHRDSLLRSSPSPPGPHSSSSPPAPPPSQASAHSGDLLTQCQTSKQVPVSGSQVQPQGELVHKPQNLQAQGQMMMLQPQGHEEKQVPSSVQNQSPISVPLSHLQSQTQSCSQSGPVLQGSPSVPGVPQSLPCVTTTQRQPAPTDSPQTFSLPRPLQPYLLPSFHQTDSPQNMSQLHLDPLYPGFPQNLKGDVVLSPDFSWDSKTGKDLPEDVNILRFFFNLGVKAFSVQWCPPSVYLLPLQHAHSIKHSSAAHSSSPPPPCPSFKDSSCQHQESQPSPSPAMSAFSHQTAPAEAAYPRDLPMNQAPYLVPQYAAPPQSWPPQQMAPPANPVRPLMYSPVLSIPPPGQGFPAGLDDSAPTERPLCPPPSLPVFQSEPSYSTAQSVHLSQGGMEQQGSSATNRDANVMFVRAMALPVGAPNSSVDQGLTRNGILVDTSPNNNSLQAVISNSDGPVTVTPGSAPHQAFHVPRPFVPRDVHRFSQQHFSANKNYVTDGAHASPVDSHFSSIACSTEGDGEVAQHYRMSNQNPRGYRRGSGGGRGRGWVYNGQRSLVIDRGKRGNRRRQGGEGFNPGHFGSSPHHRGQ